MMMEELRKKDVSTWENVDISALENNMCKHEIKRMLNVKQTTLVC